MNFMVASYRIISASTKRFIVVRVYSLCKEGEDYEPSSLQGLVSSTGRNLKKNDFPLSIINDKRFELTRKNLQSNQKEQEKRSPCIEASLMLLWR